MKYLVFEYVYVDGVGNMFPGSVSFQFYDGMSEEEEKDFLDDFEKRISENGGDNFIAHEVGIPELFGWCGDDSIDHCYHSFNLVYIESEEKFIEVLDNRTPEQFLLDFESAPKKEFMPGIDRNRSASDFFYMGKDKCTKERVYNVRVVKQESLRSFGSQDLWLATQIFCDEFVEVDGEFGMVTINAQAMIEDVAVDKFIEAAMKYDEDLNSIAKIVAESAQKCAKLGIDFMEVR